MRNRGRESSRLNLAMETCERAARLWLALTFQEAARPRTASFVGAGCRCAGSAQ
jgi:hypothetical protein